MQKVSAFKTKDGTLFETLDGAKTHEAYGALVEYFEKHFDSGIMEQGTEGAVDDVLVFIAKNQDDICNILTPEISLVEGEPARRIAE